MNKIWLYPCFASPFRDAGYDVADYLAVAPRYGADADRPTVAVQRGDGAGRGVPRCRP